MSLSFPKSCLAAVCLSACLFFANSVSAQWSTDITQNNVITNKPGRQNSCMIASDGAGGAIITWQDHVESINDYNVYAQKINAEGVIEWSTGGVPICINTAYSSPPSIISDGNGGAIIYWFDARNSNKNVIYAQKINSAGVVQWTADGINVGIVETHYQHSSPVGVSDGNGGIILVWNDWRKVDGNDVTAVYAQKITAAGNIEWGVGGKMISDRKNESIKVTSDGSGGAIAAWHEYIAAGPHWDIVIQRITSGGELPWGPGCVTVCSLTSTQMRPYIAGDGAGGAIVVWEDLRNGTKTNLYAQKVNATGAVQWAANGIPVNSVNDAYQRDPRIMSDGSGGAFIAWTYNDYTSVVQHINASGNLLWRSDGVSVSDRTSREPDMISDGGSGIIVTWYSGEYHIMAQRINSAGELQWGSRGAYVCYNRPEQRFSPKICPARNGAVIIAWNDSRNLYTTDFDVYAQRVSPDGTLGISTGVEEKDFNTGFELYQNHPNPFSDKTRINFTVNRPGLVTIKLLNAAGAEIKTILYGTFEPGSYSTELDADGLSRGFYYYIMQSGGKTFTRKMIISK